VGQDTLLVIEPTDLLKPFARKMERLAEIRDGSDKEPCLMVVAVHRDERQIVPLYQELYSQRAPDFESENLEILRAVETVAAATGERGLGVMDRGGDRQRLLVPLLDSGRRFLIRLRGDRHLLSGEEPRTAFELAASCRLPHRETVVRQEPGDEQILPLRFGARAVHLPDRPKALLYLVVVEGPWPEPILLLTTEIPGVNYFCAMTWSLRLNGVSLRPGGFRGPTVPWTPELA